MAEAPEDSKFETPFESTNEEIRVPDEDVYMKKLKDALAADPEIGPEVVAQLRDLDLRRIIRAYFDEKDRWGETFAQAKMWTVEMVQKGVKELWKQPMDADLEKVAALMPMFCHGQDKQGHPVYYEQVCQYNISELQKLDRELLKRYRDRVTVSSYELNRRQTIKRGKPIYKRVVVLDVSGLGVTNCKPYFDVVKALSNRESRLWAETVYKLYIVNAGWLFSGAWYLFKGLMHERTQKKVSIEGGGFKAKLLEVVDENMIPECFGGTCAQAPCVGGWWFPEDPLKEESAAEEEEVEEKKEQKPVNVSDM